MRKRLLAAVCALAPLTSGVAHAATDLVVSRTPASAPILGTVIRGSSATTYSVSTSGAVTRTSGNAIRLSNASVTAPTISITCGFTFDCVLRTVRVTITPAGSSGDADIVKFRRGTVSGASGSVASVSENQTLVFDLPAIGVLRTVSFPIGMDVLLDAGAGARVHTFSYTVTAEYR